MSGPIQKGKTWFIDTLDGEYDDNVSVQLPPGKDRDYVWRADNLAKLQSNVTARSIVTASFLSNYYHDKYPGLGFLIPQSATPTSVETAYLGSLKDQYYFRNGAAGSRIRRGPVQLHADATGQRSLHLSSGARPRRENPRSRAQPVRMAFPCPPTSAHAISVFSGGDYAHVYNTEASLYAEDRWLITNRLLLEPGVRLDWDQLVRTPLFSPRLAGTYILNNESNTKLSAGVGIIYGATNMGVIHQPVEGQRIDYFFKCVTTRSAPARRPSRRTRMATSRSSRCRCRFRPNLQWIERRSRHRAF